MSKGSLYKMSQLREMSDSALKETLIKEKKAALDLRLNKMLLEKEQYASISHIKKNVARIMTLINDKKREKNAR